MSTQNKTVAISANTSWYLLNFRANTIKSLIATGYRVIAVCPEDEYSGPLSQLGCQVLTVDIDQGGTNPIKDLISTYKLFGIYRKHRPDIVLNFTPKNNIYGTIAASVLKIPCVNNIAGLGLVFTKTGPTATIVKLLYKLSQPKARHIFFQNEDDREIFLANGIVDKHMTSRIPGSGVDLDRFAAVGPKHRDKTTFILVARLLKEKGIIEYIKAANKLADSRNDVEFLLLGQLDSNNPSAISSDELAYHNSNNTVRYLGTSNEVEKIIRDVDCVVLPSYYREGVPKSLLEGAAMGKPIVTTDNIGCKEVVDDGLTGYLCTPKCSGSLSEKMALVADMSFDDRHKMGMLGRKKIEAEFDENIVLEAYMKIVRRVTESNNA